MRRFLLSLIIISALAAPGWTANTWYFCGASTGSTCSPAGSGTTCSQAAPCTLTYAAGTKASSGDTLLGLNGISVEAAFVTPAVTNLTIDCVNPGQCTIRDATGADAKVLYQGAAATGLTIASPIIDGQGAQTYGLQQNPGGGVAALTLNGTPIENYTSAALYSATMHALSATGFSLLSSGTGTLYGINVTPSAAGAVSLSGGSITHLAAGNNSVGIKGIPASGSANPLIISGTNFNQTSGAAGNTIYSLYLSDWSSYSIHGNTHTITGATTGAGYGDRILNASHAANTATSCSIYGETITINAPGGISIGIGNDSDTDTNGNDIANIQIYNNTIQSTGVSTTSLHGILVAWEPAAASTAKVFSNKVSGAAFTVSFKHATNGLSHHNVGTGTAIAPMAIGSSIDKASSGSIFANMTYVENGASGIFFHTEQSDDGATQSTNSTFKNSICYGAAGSTGLIYDDAANSSTITALDYNLYFSAGSLYADPWIYRSTNYTTFGPAGTGGTWQNAGYDTHGVNADPLFYNVASGDYRLRLGSPARGKADPSVWSGTASITDINSIRITDGAGHLTVILDMGAYQSQPQSGMGFGM